MQAKAQDSVPHSAHDRTGKRGWHDEDDGSTQELERYKASSGLAHRTDLVTFFHYYEADEGRKP